MSPSEEPSEVPTMSPSEVPSVSPSELPSIEPTVSPTFVGQCPDGQAYVSNTCEHCPAGTYSNANTNWVCQTCALAEQGGAMNCDEGTLF